MYIHPEWIQENSEYLKHLTGFKPIKCLGKGSYGYVYTTDKTQYVLKITSHLEEAKAIALIINLRKRGYRLPGFPKIKTLYHFCNNKSNYFIIVREKLNVSKNFRIWVLANGFYSKEEYKSYINRFKNYKKIQSSLKVLLNHDIYLWDIRQDNIGYRDDPKQCVVFDFALYGRYYKTKVTIPSFGKYKWKKI